LLIVEFVPEYLFIVCICILYLEMLCIQFCSRFVPSFDPMTNNVTPHQELIRLAKPGLVLNSSEERNVVRLCEITKAMLKQMFLNFCVENETEPMAISYGNDSTPLQTRERWYRKWCDLTVRREGSQSKDYLIQRAWAQNLRGQAVVLFCEPLTLQDKSAASHFGAARQLVGFGLECGLRGLNIQHDVLDRAIFSAEDRLLRQQHELCLKQIRPTMSEGDWKLLCLQSWYVASGCCDHDIHNALKWSVHAEISDKAFMKEVWKVVACIRSAFHLLVDHAANWVASCIMWQEWGLQQQEALWAMLNLPPDLREELVDLQLRWEDGGLCVHPRHRNQPSIISRIEVVLLKLWYFKEWTDSRWLTMGPACKVLTAAKITGLDALVKYICSQPKTSLYYLGNYKSDPDINSFIARVAISSFVSDAALALLLEDDRVPRQWEALQIEICDELAYLNGLPMEIWSLVAVGCSLSSFDLRSKCVQGGYIQASFIFWRLRAATRLPWSLVIGDRRQNLLDLAAGPSPGDLTSWKIYQLMQLGFPIDQLLDGVELLSRLSWSSKPVEEGHASASALMKLHHRYGEAQMKARAMVCQSRSLFSRSHLEKRVSELESRMARLRKRDPGKITGKAIYVKELFSLVSQKKQEGRTLALDVTNKVIAKHGERWEAMSDIRKRQYLQKAIEARSESRDQLSAEMELVESELLNVRRQLEAEKTTDEPLKLSRCSLTSSQLQRFDDMWHDPQFSHATLQAQRKAAVIIARPPEDWDLARLSEMFIGSVPEACGESPAWAKLIAPRRDALSQSVLRLTCDEVGERFRLVLFCMQKPVLLGFLSLAAEEDVLRHPDDEELIIDVPTWAHKFVVQPNGFSWSDDDEYKGDCGIEVLGDTVWQGDDTIVSDGDWRRFETVIRLLPGPVASASSGSSVPSQPRGSMRSQLLLEHPWLADVWAANRQQGGDELGPGTEEALANDLGAKGQQGSKGSSSDEAEASVEDDVDVEEVLDAIDKKKCGMKNTGIGTEGPFAWREMSCAASSSDGPAGLMSVRGDARTGEAHKFASSYGLQYSASFVASLYGQEGAQICAEYWVAKMSYFFSIWQQSENALHIFSLAEAKGFPEPQRFTTAFEDAQGRVLVRMQWLRDLMPKHAV
jgi:hypothetical protein